MDPRFRCARLYDSVKLQFIGIAVGFGKCWVVSAFQSCVCLFTYKLIFFLVN